MKNSKESHNLTRQNEKNVQKSQKHEVNLQKNSTLFFQVGLIVCLLFAYGALEMRFEDKGLAIVDNPETKFEEDYKFTDNRFKVYEEVVETKEPVKTKAKHIIDPEIIDDDEIEKKEVEKLITEDSKKEVLKDTKPFKGVEDPVAPIEPTNVPFDIVEEMPIFPGCESSKNNDERKKCMSKKLSKIVKKKFDKDLGAELGLKEGTQRIYVNFRINKEGLVEILSTRAPHKALEREANRVVTKYVPQMIPGKQRGQNVSVLYTLPIFFNVQY